MAQRQLLNMANLDNKLFWDIVHYKVHVPSNTECTISVHKGVHVNAAKRFKLKAQRSGYHYNRLKHEYTKQVGDTIYHLIFA